MWFSKTCKVLVCSRVFFQNELKYSCEAVNDGGLSPTPGSLSFSLVAWQSTAAPRVSTCPTTLLLNCKGPDQDAALRG